MKIRLEVGNKVFQYEREPMSPERFNALCKLACAAIGGAVLLGAVHMIQGASLRVGDRKGAHRHRVRRAVTDLPLTSAVLSTRDIRVVHLHHIAGAADQFPLFSQLSPHLRQLDQAQRNADPCRPQCHCLKNSLLSPVPIPLPHILCSFHHARSIYQACPGGLRLCYGFIFPPRCHKVVSVNFIFSQNITVQYALPARISR